MSKCACGMREIPDGDIHSEIPDNSAAQQGVRGGCGCGGHGHGGHGHRRGGGCGCGGHGHHGHHTHAIAQSMPGSQGEREDLSGGRRQLGLRGI